MVLIKSIVLAAVVATAAARSAVIDLMPSNFDKVVLKSGKPTLVEFFAPWCGHCKTLAPVYEELALAFEHAKDKVQIAKVDADAERSLGKRFNVQGFPTLKFFDGKSDKPEEYSSGRDIESLKKFITEKTGVKTRKKVEMPSKVEMLTKQSFPDLVGKSRHALVAFTAPWCGHCKSLAPTWETVARDFADEANVLIAKVDAEAEDAKALAQEHGVSSYPTIKWFPAGSTTPEDYMGSRNEADFINWINEKAGTHRLPGGSLDSSAGTVAMLDEIVAKLTGGASLADTTAEAKKAATKISEDAQYKYAEYYIRVFDKLSKSDDYVAKELARLDGILTKGGLAPSKRDELHSKTNILRKFAEKLAEEVKLVKDEL